MNFTYKKSDFGKYTVCNGEGISIIVFTETSAITLSELLNKTCKRIEYQDGVIDKCIRNKKRYQAMLSDRDERIRDLDLEIGRLNKEKRILKKIIYELDDELKYYTGGYGVL